MLYLEYYKEVLKVLDQVITTQKKEIEAAADIASEVMLRDGIIYVFGCGHSHIIGEDLFYRAGGLASVSAILDSALMLHDGAIKSSHMEQISGIAEPLIDRHGITSRDMLIIISTSGINSVPIEAAKYAKEKKIPVVTITASAYEGDESRHSSGKHMYEFGDIAIDNCVCHGDASVTVGKTGCKTGPISTISGCLIAQSIMVQAAENVAFSGMKPPLYISGNLPGGMEQNKKLIELYGPRMKHL